MPKIIHQVFPGNLPLELEKNVLSIKEMNPGWQHILYDDSQMLNYITSNYGEDIAAYYLRINPAYGAARADLFRYLVIYKSGGLYLDIKSTTTGPLDRIIRADDTYILAQWRNGTGQIHEGFGLWKELTVVPGGEYQQWHIIGAPGHPFLRAVITTVLMNIDQYRPWDCGVGKAGVLRLTGPIAYTRAINSVIDQHRHRLVTSEADLSLKYSIMEGMSHTCFFERHYSSLVDPVVKLRGWVVVSGLIYSLLKKVAHFCRFMSLRRYVLFQAARFGRH